MPAQIAERPSRRLYWAAGLAAAAVVSIIAFAFRHSPQQPATPLPEGAHVAPPPAVEEPKREVARDEVERLLDKDTPPEQPRVVEPEKQEPRKTPIPPPASEVKPPEPPAPPSQPEKKAVAREEQKTPITPEKPSSTERETFPVAATLSRVQGSVFVIVSGAKAPAKAGQPLPAGAGIETSGQGSHAIFEYEDGSRIALGADTILAQVWDRHTPAGKAAEGKQIHLVQGLLAAQVVKQPAGEPMIFQTPHAEARVPGTRLSLAITPASTRLDVRQGRSVKMTRKEDGVSAEVGEGHYALAGKGLAPVAKAAPGPKVFLQESFKHGKWSSALAQGGDASRGMRFSTETGALSILASQRPPADVAPVIGPPTGTPNPSTKLSPDAIKKAGDIVTHNLGGKGDLPRTLWLETRPTFALSNETPLRIRVRLWQSHSDADRSSWIAINRVVPGQAILVERRGSSLQLWSESAQAPLWKKDLPCVQEWESLELWLTKDQILVRRDDRTIQTDPNPLKVKMVQIAFGSSAKAELPQDEEARFDDFELAWTTKADWEDVSR